jgi:hypothetical protein
MSKQNHGVREEESEIAMDGVMGRERGRGCMTRIEDPEGRNQKQNIRAKIHTNTYEDLFKIN